MANSSFADVSLGDIADFRNGKAISPEKYTPVGKHPVFGSNGQIARSDEVLYPDPAIVIGRVGAYCGCVHYVPRASWITDNAIVAFPKNGNDIRYLFYLLGSLELQRTAIGSAQPLMTQGGLKVVRTKAPPLAEQKAIAAVLGALDDKIELNRRMNATLEAMARALFQSWFVDFDPVRAKLDGRPPAALDPATAALFPDSFQDSPIGPIPHGWRAAHLEEIASVGSGKRPEGRCDVLSPECNIPLYGGGGRMGYVPSSLYDKPILFTGRVGTLGLIFRTAEPSWPSDNTLIVEPQAGHFDFTYFVLKGFDLITLNRGSTQPLLTQTDLKRQTFVLPTKDVVKAFADFSEPIFRQIVSNERESRTLANYAFHADITDCYSAIYTHSIAWAVHGRPKAKAERNNKGLIGNIIDSHIQDMRHGQTNGIPQGSTLMDFISELVLGYADLELSERLKAAGITDFRILRYRDDYRIFVQSPQIGEAILKCLTEVLIDLGLKLNASKTTGAQLVVSHAIKPDTRAWLRGRQGDANLQKHLLVIHAHGHDFPNAGSLTVALTHFHERLNATKRVSNPLVLISIATDIAYHSPKAFPVCSAIISKLLSVLPTKVARVDAIQKMHTKLSQLPNTGHMEAWLQRISHSFVPNLAYKETLCRLVKGDSVALWNNDWITSAILKAAIDPAKIVNKAKLRSLKPIVRPKEIELFASERY